MQPARHSGETIVIGGTVEVSVLSVRGNTVRLGIEASLGTTVYRLEVQQVIDRGEKS